MRLWKELKRRFEELNEFVWAFKAGMETEGLPERFFKKLVSLADRFFPLIFKLGGVEARYDLFIAKEFEAFGVTVPMAETPFAVDKFLKMLSEIYIPAVKGINIETFTAVKNLSEILKKDVELIVIGRGDLASSIGEDVESSRVRKMVLEVLQKSKAKDKKVSLGGGISKRMFEWWSPSLPFDFVNTRFFFVRATAFNLKRLRLLLESEMLIFEILSNEHPELAEWCRKRIKVLEERAY